MRVIIESPFAGDVKANTVYAQRCMADSFERGESPLASHLLYPQVLDDNDVAEREQGINAGLDWGRVADLCAVYDDFGISPGMEEGIKGAKSAGVDIDRRSIGKWHKPKPPTDRLIPSVGADARPEPVLEGGA